MSITVRTRIPANLIEVLEAVADRPFITSGIDEDRQDTLTAAEFSRRAAPRRERWCRGGVP